MFKAILQIGHQRQPYKEQFSDVNKQQRQVQTSSLNLKRTTIVFHLFFTDVSKTMQCFRDDWYKGCSYYFMWMQCAFFMLFGLQPARTCCIAGCVRRIRNFFFIRFEANLSENGSYSLRLHIRMFRYIRKHHLFVSFASYSLQNMRTDSHTNVRFDGKNSWIIRSSCFVFTANQEARNTGGKIRPGHLSHMPPLNVRITSDKSRFSILSLNVLYCKTGF